MTLRYIRFSREYRFGLGRQADLLTKHITNYTYKLDSIQLFGENKERGFSD